MEPLKAVKYNNRFYKSLHNLYQLNKNEDSPTYSGFIKALSKTKSIGSALKKTDKKLRTIYYQKLYEDNKTENSVSKNLFIRRMRHGAKLNHALYRKKSKTLKSPRIIEGNIFYSFSQIADYYKLSPSTIINRHKKNFRGIELIKGSKYFTYKTKLC